VELKKAIVDALERVLGLGEQLLSELVGQTPDAETFRAHRAFRFDAGRGPGRLLPIEAPSAFDLDDLIGVEDSVASLERNTRQLLAGHPCNNALLHGERGTGKSSAVRGLLSRYGDAGLRLIEVEKRDLVHLPHILDMIRLGSAAAEERFAFVLFCDDLSFDKDELGYRELKAALDGSLQARPENVCIVATSNRRHLVPESMAENRQARLDPGGELHLGEALEEKLALAERFGLVLGFYNFNQRTYLAIVEHYLKKAGLPGLDDEVRTACLAWALARGSRSGRVARQFVDDHVGRVRLEADAARK